MSSVPLLGGDDAGAKGGGGGGEADAARRPASSWLGRVADTAEASAQLRFAVPMVLTSMAFYGIPLVSVMFSGHLGDVHLAGATLGNSWATVTGYAFVVRTHTHTRIRLCRPQPHQATTHVLCACALSVLRPPRARHMRGA
jgi:MATE family multidrug resistance protein